MHIACTPFSTSFILRSPARTACCLSCTPPLNPIDGKVGDAVFLEVGYDWVTLAMKRHRLFTQQVDCRLPVTTSNLLTPLIPTRTCGGGTHFIANSSAESSLSSFSREPCSIISHRGLSKFPLVTLVSPSSCIHFITCTYDVDSPNRCTRDNGPSPA